MKKVILFLLSFMMIVTFAACGSGKNDETAATGQAESTAPTESDSGGKGVADKYRIALTAKDGVFYYEGKSKEQYSDEDGSQGEEIRKAEARDGADQYVLMTGKKTLDSRQIDLGKKQIYIVDDKAKQYYMEDKLTQEPTNSKYVKTAEMKLGKKTCQYDEYQGEYSLESYGEDEKTVTGKDTYSTTTKYLVDDEKQLAAVIYTEADKKTGETTFKRTDTITKFRLDKLPKGIFDIPKDYKKIDPENQTLDEWDSDDESGQ